MTKEEALTIIKGYKIHSLGISNHSEAFDVAIECIQYVIGVEGLVNTMFKNVEKYEHDLE